MAEKLYDAYHREIELTSEQEACLKYSGDCTLMVKGFAGAGKSLVLMQLARELLKKYGADSKNKVAIFTFQNTLVSTTREFLEINGSEKEGIVVTTFNFYINEIYKLLINCGKASRKNYPNNDNQRKDNVKAAIKAHQKTYGKHRFYSIDPKFWLEEFDWMKDMNVWTDDMDMYLSIPRKGRGGKVRMSAADRVTAFQLYLCYCEQLEKTNQADWADQTLYLIRHPELIPEDMKFEYVLVDEAQDLSLAQMLSIMTLYKKNMVVAMDMNQRIFGKHWTTKQLGIETTTKKLTKSMRTTKQIDALAESVRSKNDGLLSEDDKCLRAIPEREGDIPEMVRLDDEAAERKYIVNLVKSYLDQNNKITIGIIAAKKKQINKYADWLSSENIKHEQVQKDSTFSMANPGVKLVSAYGAKGLEFDIVIIPMFEEGNFPYGYQPDDEEIYEQYMIKMRNLVYVSMTRARFRLVITFSADNGSRFIADMDSELYKLTGDKPNIRPISFVPKITSIEGSNDSASVVRTTMTTQIKPSGPDANIEGKSSKDMGLLEFLISKGFETIDTRPKGGHLWIIGDQSIDPIIKETKQKFGVRWIFKPKGSIATKYRPGWYTKSEK